MAKKCYNSLSCILSVAVIVFILGAILIDVFYTKPEMRNSIEDIRIEVKDIHRKIDLQSVMIKGHNNVLDSVSVVDKDSVVVEKLYFEPADK